MIEWGNCWYVVTVAALKFYHIFASLLAVSTYAYFPIFSYTCINLPSLTQVGANLLKQLTLSQT